MSDNRQNAQYWDFLSLIKESSNYCVSDYGNNKRFEDFFEKYSISSNNISARINDLLSELSHGHPGHKQLIVQTILGKKKRGYSLTSAGIEFLENSDYKRQAEFYSTQYFYEALLSILEYLEKLSTNYYLEDVFYQQHLGTLQENISQTLEVVEEKIDTFTVFDKSTILHPKIPNFDYTLLNEVSVEQVWEQLKERHVYTMIAFFKALYTTNPVFLTKLLQRFVSDLSAYIITNKDKESLHLCILLLFLYVKVDHDHLSDIQSTMNELYLQPQSAIFYYITDVLEFISSTNTDETDLTTFIEFFSFDQLSKTIILDTTTKPTFFYPTSFLKQIDTICPTLYQQLLETILEQLNQNINDDSLRKFEDLLRSLPLDEDFFIKATPVLKNLLSRISLHKYPQLDTVFDETSLPELLLQELNVIAHQKLMTTTLPELNMFYTYLPAKTPSLTWSQRLAKRMTFERLNTLMVNEPTYNIARIISKLQSIHAPEAKLVIDTLTEQQWTTIFQAETSIPGVRLLIYIVQQHDEAMAKKLLEQNKTKLLELVQGKEWVESVWILIDCFGLAPRLIHDLALRTLEKHIHDTNQCTMFLEPLIMYGQQLFQDIKMDLEHLIQQHNLFEYLLYLRGMSYDDWSVHILEGILADLFDKQNVFYNNEISSKVLEVLLTRKETKITDKLLEKSAQYLRNCIMQNDPFYPQNEHIDKILTLIQRKDNRVYMELRQENIIEWFKKTLNYIR